MNIEVGKKLPNFIGKTHLGQDINLAKFFGENNIVLYFYPKDDTPGCTVEGIEFSQLNKEFKKQNTLVFGMSRDSLDSHTRFCNKNNIHLPLLSDVNGEYGRKLGLLKESGSYIRTTALIGRDGKIKHIWENVKANDHAAEVLSKVKELEHNAQKKISLGKDLGSTRRSYTKPAQKSASKSRFK
ncbi:MAG: peroxiredoxin [bacterium]|nr:peroxiredoxin [bacterium]